MSEQKRKLAETDPDYDDNADQQAKRQRVLEQDAREAACKKITSIIKKEFSREISDKEKELIQIDLRLNQARLIMDRLRACVVASYYGRANRTLSSAPSSDCSSSKVPPPNIHPTVKKFIGKAPRNPSDQTSTSSSSISANLDIGFQTKDSQTVKVPEETTCTRTVPSAIPANRSIVVSSPTPRTLLSNKVSKPQAHSAKGSYEDRRARFKIKKKIVVGNVSRYIPVDQRESTDMSSHKWMVYVRGHKSDPDISDFVKKVWFFLHHSYKPNDHVEISSPPFHLTRRGWGEFPVRVQLHFVDSRNKKVDIIHHLKLDKTFTGLQKLGAETVVEVELERDFFESVNDEDDESHQPALPREPRQLYTASQKLSSSSSSFSSVSSRVNSSTCQTLLSPNVQSVSKSVIDSECTSSSSTSSLSSSSQQSNAAVIELHQEKEVRKPNHSELQSKTESAKVMQILNDKDVKGTVVDHEKNSAVDGGNTDTSWIKVESEEVEVDGGFINVNSDVRAMDSNQTRCIEKTDDHSIAGQVIDELHFTIKHEEGLEQTLEEEMDIQYFEDIADENVVHCEEVVSSTSNISNLHEEFLEEETVDVTPNMEQIQAAKVSYSSSQSNNNQVCSSSANASISSNHSALRQPGVMSVSLLTPSAIERMKQQQQTTKKISLLKSPGVHQEKAESILTNQTHTVKETNASLIPTPQPIVFPNQKTPATVQKFTVINIAKHKGSTLVQTSTVPAEESTKAASQPGTPVSSKVTKNLAVTPGKLKILNPNMSPSVAPVSTDPQPATKLKIVNPTKINTGTQVLQVVNPPNKVTAGNNLHKQTQQYQHHHPNVVKKVSLLPPKISVLKPTSLLSAPAASQAIVPPANPAMNNPKPSTSKGKKQVSLLTGLVVNAASNAESNAEPPKPVLETSPTLHQSSHQLNPNANVVTLHPSQLGEAQFSENVVTVANPSCRHIPQNINIVTDNAQMIVSKSAKSPHTVINQGLPVARESSSNYSLVNSSTTRPVVQVLEKKLSTPNSILAQTSTPNIVIAYPNSTYNTVKTEPSSLSNILSNNSAPEYSEIKMSAIGKTKLRGIQQPLVHGDPMQERILKQYQVLNDYKKSISECQKEQQRARLYNDTIEGEADIIPKINPDEYPDVFSLTKAAIRLHPIIQNGVNKLTHPYCAESRDQWFSWPVGKQRASEWSRACFTLKYMKRCIRGAFFKGEQLMTTKQLVHWCRLHAFSPQTPIFPNPDTITKEERASPVNFLPHPHVNDPPQSFTNAADLKSRISILAPPGPSTMNSQDVEIVLEEFAPPKLEVKEEIVDTEEGSEPELPPLTNGAVFAHDWMRKRGVKLITQDNADERISADLLYQVMMEFGSDILRKSFAVYSEREKPSDNLNVQDIHTALCSLPVAAFCRNSFLGKEEEEDESAGSNASR